MKLNARRHSNTSTSSAVTLSFSVRLRVLASISSFKDPGLEVQAEKGQSSIPALGRMLRSTEGQAVGLRIQDTFQDFLAISGSAIRCLNTTASIGLAIIIVKRFLLAER